MQGAVPTKEQVFSDQCIENGKFDWVVDFRDPKTGRVVKREPYRLYAHNGVQLIEKPKGSGNLWYENLEPAGVVTLDKAGKQVFKIGAEHQSWVKPLTEDEKLQAEMDSLEAKNKQLTAEVRALKAEKTAKIVEPVKSAAKVNEVLGATEKDAKERS